MLTKTVRNVLVLIAVVILLSCFIPSWAFANSNASATAAINNLKTQQYYKPGGACPSGLGVGWLKYGNKSTYCTNECYAFASGVSESLFGSHPGGVIDTGYTCQSPANYNCSGSLKNPSFDAVKSLFQKSYPGDWIQFCSGGSWGEDQHSAILEAVEVDGVRIYQHGNDPHVSSTFYSWNNLYYSYLTMNSNNKRGFRGVSIYHAKNYDQKFPNGDEKGKQYSGNTVTTVPEGTEFIIKAAGNPSYVWDVAGGKGCEGCNLQLYSRSNKARQKFKFAKNSDGTYRISNWSGDYGVFVGLKATNYKDSTRIALRYMCDWDINSWYVETTPDGYYSFRNKYSGRYIDVSGGSYADKSRLQQWNGGGVTAQKFILEAQMYPGNKLASASELKGTFLVQSAKDNNLVWDVKGGSGTDGTNLQIYARNSTLAQRFTFAQNDDGTYSISNWSGTPGTLVGLAANSYMNKGNVAMRTYVRSWDINKWYVEKTPDGYYSFRNKYSSLYMDIAWGNYSSGTNLWQYEGNGSIAQKFKLAAYKENTVVDDLSAGDPGFVIRNVRDSKQALTSDTGSWGDGSVLSISSYSKSEKQRYVFSKNDDGTYSISNWAGAPGLLVGLKETNSDAGTNAALRHYVATWDINRWYVETTSSGYYAFRNKYSGLYLDAPASSGGKVIQSKSSSDTSQQWVLEPCDYYYTSLDDAVLTLDYSSCEYTGAQLKPKVVVSLNGKQVDSDCYSVQYLDNVQVGTATVTVSGLNAKRYSGTATQTFEITGIDIAKATVSGLAESYEYSGEPIEPKPTIAYKGNILVEGVDYALSYNGSDSVGEVEIVILGIGNYSGESVVPYAISPKAIAMPVGESFEFDGSEHTGLSAGEGYTVAEGATATRAGTYTAIAQLAFGYIWDAGAYDDVDVEWSIAPADISMATIDEIEELQATGDVLTPPVTVRMGEKTLEADVEYSVSYADNVAPGIGTVLVIGKGDYTGSKSASFAIGQASIANAKVYGVVDKAYAGDAVEQDDFVLVFAGQELIAYIDYTVSYADNDKVGTATMVFTGKGNYTGEKVVHFAIKANADGGSGEADDQEAVDIAKAKVVLSQTSFAYNGKVQKPSVKTIGGRQLREGTDYVVSYSDMSSVNAGTYQAIVVGKGEFAGTATASYKILQAKNSAKAVKASVSKTLKAKNLKKSAKPITLPKVQAKFGKAKWSVAAKDKKKALSLKDGKVQVKKGTKPGTYTIKLKAKVAKTKNYTAATTKAVTVKVKVK